MRRKFANTLQVIGGIMATIGCLLFFGARFLVAGTSEGTWLLLYSGILGAILLFGGILLVHYGEKKEKP